MTSHSTGIPGPFPRHWEILAEKCEIFPPNPYLMPHSGIAFGTVLQCLGSKNTGMMGLRAEKKFDDIFSVLR